MFTITNIQNLDCLFRTVNASSGDVSLHLPDESCFNLKDAKTQQLMQLSSQKDSHLQISLSNPSDFPRFLQFMMEAAK